LIEGVIFDLWNTVIRSSGPRLVGRLASIIERLGGVPCSEETVTDYLRAAGCLHTATSSEDVAEDLWRTIVGRKPPTELRTLVAAESEEFATSAEFLPGAREILSRLRGLRVKTSVVSNASTASLDVVENLDIGGMFDDVWISCQSGYLKPDPRAFIVVADAWSIDPANICVIGDKLSTDVLGARLAGMQCIWLASTMETVPANVDSSIAGVVRNLWDAVALIERMKDGAVQ
jgi:HAD superfamily hydrolase (TIGR01549 family)